MKVMTFGVWDLMHEGHMNLLERARNLGDYLIVGVPTSWTIAEHIKGRAPVQSAETRLRLVRPWCDFAFIYTDSQQIEESIRLIKPDIVCRADDNKDFVGKKAAEEIGAKIIYLPRTEGVSSTELRRQV